MLVHEMVDGAKRDVGMQFALRETDAGWPPCRPGGGGAKARLACLANERVRVVTQCLFRRKRDALDVVVAQPPGVEAEPLEQLPVVGRLARRARRLAAKP